MRRRNRFLAKAIYWQREWESHLEDNLKPNELTTWFAGDASVGLCRALRQQKKYDDAVEACRAALVLLEHPKMQEVYALMNAVQYEIMANRFEALARAMQSLQPSQEL